MLKRRIVYAAGTAALLAGLSALAAAQTIRAGQTAAATATTESSGAPAPTFELPPSAARVPPDYKLAPGDVVNVSVYNMPELNRVSQTLGNDGTLHLEYLATPVPALDETTAELARAVAAALRAQQILVDPQVDVSVAQVEGHPVSVSGEVHAPTVLQATGNLHLLDAIFMAGGPTAAAGLNVVITRDVTAGAPPLTTRIPLSSLLSGDPQSNPLLQSGDFVRVESAGQAYIVGDFHVQGAFTIPPGGLTVTRALAIAQGWNSDAKPSAAQIIHQEEGGSVKVTHIDLKSVIQRKSDDPFLSAGDVLYLPSSTARSVGVFTAKGVGAAFAVAIGYLIVDR